MKFSFNSYTEGVGLLLNSDNRRVLTEALYSWYEMLSPLVTKQVELIHVRPGVIPDPVRNYPGIHITVKFIDLSDPHFPSLRGTKREIVVESYADIFTSGGHADTKPTDVMKELTQKLKKFLKDEIVACETIQKENRTMLALL